MNVINIWLFHMMWILLLYEMEGYFLSKSFYMSDAALQNNPYFSQLSKAFNVMAINHLSYTQKSLEGKCL